MRTVRFVACLSLLAMGTAMAQVPNAGFEQWTSFGTYQDPTGWTSLNILTSSLGASASCEQYTPASAGSYAVKVTTRNLLGLGVLPGLLLSGSPDAAVDGFPYTSRPQALNGKWRADLATGDQATVVVTLTRWDAVAGERVTVGGGAVITSGDINAWTNFSAVIEYAETSNPDTASIAILSSTGDGVEGSWVAVDELGFGGAVGIGEAYTGNYQLYPVPAADQLTLTTDRPVQSIELWAADGRLVLTARPGTDRVVMDLSAFSAGAYTLVARMDDATVLRRTVVK
ncbi:MAG: hypothetical protein JNL52_04860 [Flavobacteriales bacterium]|nr:hypothetical protein [Flavobacteriales bacterium]